MDDKKIKVKHCIIINHNLKDELGRLFTQGAAHL